MNTETSWTLYKDRRDKLRALKKGSVTVRRLDDTGRTFICHMTCSTHNLPRRTAIKVFRTIVPNVKT